MYAKKKRPRLVRQSDLSKGTERSLRYYVQHLPAPSPPPGPSPASKLGKAGGKVKDQVERPRYTITGTEIFDGLVSFAIVCCDVNSYGLILPDVYALIHVTDIVFCVTFPSSDADILP